MVNAEGSSRGSVVRALGVMDGVERRGRKGVEEEDEEEEKRAGGGA